MSFDTIVTSVFRKLDVKRNMIGLQALREEAKLLDKFAWNDENLAGLFEDVEVTEDGRVNILIFDSWVTCENKERRNFIKTFIERELSGDDKGILVDVCVELPTSPGAQVAWSPYRPRGAPIGEIMGHAEGGGILVQLAPPKRGADPEHIVVKKGQIRLRQHQKETCGALPPR